MSRLSILPGSGELTLPSGDPAVAEPLGPGEAYVVRALDLRAGTGFRPLLKLSLLGRDRGLLEVGGRRVELRPRLAEILALRCASPQGVSAKALCADLHGDGGSPTSVRVEVSRLRKLIGRGSTPTATASHATARPMCAGSRAACAAARCARRPRSTRARCCRARRRPASCASAIGSRAGCARR